jgi:hypothetical protein
VSRPGAWALVVGIDAYDDPSIRRLRGAVADACAMVGWLRAFGVPEAQILLHLAPSDDSRSRADAVGMSYQPAREPDIWHSIVDRLKPVADGEWLLVYLAGHGLYDPSTQRLFLTQEAGPDAYVNLGIELYTEYFRSMSFADQFLIMDGCLNYPYPSSQRPTIKADMRSGVTGFTARPRNGWAAVFAASQDERALEIAGGGLFTRELLKVLDPTTPDINAQFLDFTSGDRWLDLALAMQRVTPSVVAIANAQTPPQPQTPQLDRRGRFANAEPLPLVPMTSVPVSRIDVDVRPAIALDSLEHLRIAVDDLPYWDHRLPSPPARTISGPITAALPKGLTVSLVARMASDSGWLDERVERRFRSDTDQRVTLEYRRFDPGDDPNRHEVRTLPPGGGAGPAPDFDARGIGPYPREGNVSIERTESGRTVTFDAGAGDLVATITERVAQRAWRSTPTDIGVEVRMARHAQAHGNLRLVLPRRGAIRLAGALAYHPTVRLSPQRVHALPAWRSSDAISLADIAQEPIRSVEPGPLTVSVDLPWGSWQHTVRVPATGVSRVRIPPRIGNPPLRLRLLREASRPDVAVVGTGLRPDQAWLNGLDNGRSALARAAKGDGDWAFRLRGAESRVDNGLYRFTVAGKRYAFPASDAPLGVAIGDDWIRVEPLSVVQEPIWDLLVAVGRLDALAPEDLVALSRQKWLDPLLGVAAAYGLYAARSWAYLDEVLGNLARLTRIPDVPLLRSAAAIQQHKKREQAIADRPNAYIPRFRWGVEIGADLSQSLDEGWVGEMSAIANHLSPLSIWTAWRETH